VFSKHHLIDSARIATPCPARWAEMEGDDRMRYCSLCKLNVYDVSEMTRDQADDLIRTTSGRLCMRLHMRADGRILTRDCPVGKSAIRKRLALVIASGAAILIAGLGKASSVRSTKAPAESDFGVLYAKAKQKVPDSGVFGKKGPTPPSPATHVLTGMVALPPPPAPGP
jgi:hypothetical protein